MSRKVPAKRGNPKLDDYTMQASKNVHTERAASVGRYISIKAGKALSKAACVISTPRGKKS
jgi:hypothetical protein